MNLKCIMLSAFLQVYVLDALMLIKFFYNYYYTLFFKNKCTKYENFRTIVPVKILQRLSVVNPMQ